MTHILRRSVVVLVCFALATFGLPVSLGALGIDADRATAQEVPASEDDVSGSQEAERRELPSERTLTSKTFLNPDGTRTAEIHSGAIHYRDSAGALRPVDTTFVPSEGDGYAFETAATAYDLKVPADIAEHPLVVRHDGERIAFQPEGASGAPVADGPRVTFPGAYPGVDLVYEATPTGVRELLVVADEASLRDFTFTIDAPAVEARTTADGDVVLQSSGQDVALLDSPYVYEQAEPSTATHSPVDMDIAQGDSGEIVATLHTSAAWAADEARDYPLVIDPTITLDPPSEDCWIGQGGATTSHCGASSNYVKAGWDTNAQRGLVRFNTASIPENATISSGTVKLYLDHTQTLDTTKSAQYRLDRATKFWTSDATWNRYNSSTNWAAPGGDYNTDLSGSAVTLSGSTSGYKSFDATALVNSWTSANGVNNNGVVLRQVGDLGSTPTRDILSFVSSDNGNSFQGPNETRATRKPPKLEVTYTEPSVAASDKIGEREFYTFESQRLNDRMELKVNVATGNLLFKQTDVSLSGTGLSYSFQRFYNSLATSSDPASLSSGWSTGIGATTRLITSSGTAGRIIFVGPSGYRVRFDKSLGEKYAAAEPGIKADLVDVTGGYKLTWYSKEVWHFDSAGRLTKQEDKNGNFITFTYTNGQLTKVTDTRGKDINLTYNTSGLLATLTETTLGRTYTYGYTNGRLTSSKLTSYTPNSSDANLNKVTTYTYDGAGRLSKIIDPRSGAVETQINYVGSTDNRVASIERNAVTTGPTTQFTYFSGTTGCEGNDTVTAKTEVNGPRSAAEVPETTNPLSKSRGDDITTYCYDEHDRVRKTIDAKDNHRDTKYTSNSNVAELSESGVGAPTSIGYDSGGNATSMKLPTGGTASMSYGDTANEHMPTGVKDFASGSASGADTWEYQYDAEGNLIKAHASNGSDADITFRYCYDGKGNLDRIDQPPQSVNPTPGDSNCRNSAAQGNDTLFTYDTQGRLTKVDPPGGNATYEITGYDAASRVTQTKDGKGNVSSYVYDALDRVRQITTTNAGGTQSATITYTYDPNGNLLTRTDGSGTSSFTYDALNRMSFDDPPDTNVGTTYHYDAASNLVKLETYGEGTPITYTYDEVNLVTKVVDFNGRSTLFEHGDRNQRTKTTYPGGAVMESVYDDSRRLLCTFSYTGTRPTIPSGQKCPNPSSSLIAYSKYGYQDAAGKDTNRRESYTDRFGVTTDYDYDSISRLKAASSSGTDYAYAYDVLGNVTRETAGSLVTNYAFNDANELCWSGPTAGSCGTVPSGSTTYGYDAVGNLTSSSAGFSASYNVMNQSTSITAPGQSALPMTYADFTQDRRLSAGGMTFSYDQLGLSVQAIGNGQPDSGRFVRDPNGTLVAMTHNDVNHTPNDLYYHFDGLGSVVATTNPSGSVVKRYTYEPYGKQTNLGSNGTDYNPWRYASGYYDTQTKLLKFGTRYYDPEILRWTQRDPEMGKPNQPMTLNAYSYVGGDPVGNTDLSGRSFLGIDCPFGENEDGGCNGGSIDEPETWLTQFGGRLVGGLVGVSCYGVAVYASGGVAAVNPWVARGCYALGQASSVGATQLLRSET